MEQITVQKVGDVTSSVEVSGAKNSVLPLICASVMFEKCTFSNVPQLTDVKKLLEILSDDLDMTFQNGTELNINSNSIPKKVSLNSPRNSEIRYSTLLMGALLGKGCTHITIPKSGGCSSFGERPIDIHLDGFVELGFTVSDSESSTIISGEIFKGDKRIKLRFPSVGATINLIFASLQTKHSITIENVAIEPEIIDLISYLNKRGSNIKISDRVISVSNTETFGLEVTHRVINDRIEALSYIVLSVVSKSSSLIKKVPYIYMEQPLRFLKSLGVELELKNKDGSVSDVRVKRFIPVEGQEPRLETGVYPKIGTDYQPVIAPLMLYTGGTIVDEIYPLRFKYLEELKQLGVEVDIEVGKATITKWTIKSTDNITMNTYDLRSGFFNVIIGSNFSKVCTIKNAGQVFRGYENLESKLNCYGIQLSR
ncbi:hypothetical protein [Psychrosphaera aestuarii]|uniref:hypothetical protein n=1 Tax=Psychrosphaera aestuarii TaxID=1266052 RepID=UPI001B33D7DD|nr:hypothetical protein [Psychrosphaera aestuarii]